MKNILITRSKSRSKKLKEHLESLDYKVFIEALFSIKKNFLINDFLLKNPQKISNILISSANAIYVLKVLKITKETPIYTVGSSTADKIKNLVIVMFIIHKKLAEKNFIKLLLKILNQKLYIIFMVKKLVLILKLNYKKKVLKLKILKFIKLVKKKVFQKNYAILIKTINLKKF